jgi:signal transduction histidine kinase
VVLEWQGDVLGVMGAGHSDGTPLSHYVRSILPTLAGELSLTLRHVLSIQQRDRANLDLVRERLKLGAVFETAPLGLLVTNGQGQIELMNRTAGEHTGCGSPEDWIGRPVEAFMDDVLERMTEPEKLVERIRSEIDRSGTFAEVEVRIATPEPRTLLLFSSRVLGDDGRLTARIWASRDATAERLLGDQLRHAQKLETLGTLSGGIAHDFNNQLAVILGNARFARDNLASEAFDRGEVDEALVDLERAAEHCAQLTRSLLAFARRAPVSLGLVSPGELMRDLGELLRPLIPTSIELRCEIEDGLPAFMGDAAQLQQVLVNLALNARDAIEEHGEIAIRIGVESRPQELAMRSGVGRPGRHLVMRVSDSGCGIERDAVERVFEPFYTTKPVGKGTGLGLAIVHGVVTAHSGWVEVESEPGSGTEFRIHLPLDGDEQSRQAADPRHGIALAAAAGERERVLVADDDEALRNMLVRGLRAHGFEAEAAADGEAAVKRFAERPDAFAAVVLDWTMPGLEGPEAAAEIRRIAPDVPILLATGHGERHDAEGLEIVAKPFALADLARRLRERIDAS